MAASLLHDRGIRNNNPGNIRASTLYTWAGQSGHDLEGYATFRDAAYGLRAMRMLLMHYYSSTGLKTISGVILRWAPPHENDTNSYVHDVCARMGIDGAAPLKFPDDLPRLMRAMIIHENGVCPYTADQLKGTDAPQLF